VRWQWIQTISIAAPISSERHAVRRLWRAAVIALSLGHSAQAGELPTVPILKVEVGTHTAMIRRLVLDEAHDRVVTAGDDKTVRLWSLRDGDLIRTVHLPLGPAHEGQINGLAISPDGRVVAAGGRTGWDLDGRAWLYLIDVATGRFIGRIDDLPEIICYLTYSRTGEYLAVGLCRDKGLRVYRMSDRVLIFSDTEFLDRIAGMDFARDGRLAVTSYGGDVRLYSPAFRRMARMHLDDGTQPTIVRFSPDGNNLAIGYLDAAAVTLMRADTLEVTGRRRPLSSTGSSDLPGVAWSADGRFVYAYGGSAAGENVIWRFQSSRPGGEVSLGRVHGRWTALEATADGGFVYAAEDPVPAWGRLAAGGQSVYERRPPVQDFAKLCGSLEVADDFAVRFAPSALHSTHAMHSTNRVSFAPAQNFFGIAETPPLAAQRYQLSPTSTPDLRTQEWEGTTDPRLNDRPLKLDPYEIARCVAVDEPHLRVAMGSEWTLRLFNSDAALIWAIPLSQVVRTVGFTPDGRFVVAGLSDGTLRWYRSSDGAEIVAALLHSDLSNWIAWTPDGYYNSSLEGDSLIGWHVNRGRDHAADFFRAVQFDRLLYRPDAVRAAYVEANPRPSVLAGITFTPASLNPILPPVIEARLTIAGTGTGHGYLDLDAELRGGPMQRLQVFVNGIPTLPVADQVLPDPHAANLQRRLDVLLAAGSNKIRVEIATPSAIGVGEAKLVAAGGASAPSGDLYVLAIGVNHFDDASFESLHFAVADAAGVVAAANQREGAFHRVHALEVSDGTGGASGKRVTEALKFLEGAGPGDTVVLFLASHGISDSQGNYYFVPTDAKRGDAERVLEGASSADSLIRWTTFFDVLRTLPGRRIVIVDTCQSGYFGGTFDVTSLAKRSFTSHFALVAASKGDEESQEYPSGRHGLFTYGFLQGWLHPPPGRDAGTLDAMFQGAARFVADHSDTMQTPQIIAPPPLGHTRLSGMPQRVLGKR
jgi:WD40 repeat protein